MPINSKEKGKRGERDAVKFLRGSGFRNARRSQQYSGNDGTADIIVPELAYIHIEVKFRFDIGVGTAFWIGLAVNQAAMQMAGRCLLCCGVSRATVNGNSHTWMIAHCNGSLYARGAQSQPH